MKTLHLQVAVVLAGLISAVFLSGCASDQESGNSIKEVRMGPQVFNGITNYPAHPGASYTNTAVEYTTNPPPTGVAPFVTVYFTNSIVIRNIDAERPAGTTPK